MTAPTVTPELKALLRRVKLGRCLDTLPERLALAQTGGMGHAEFLELVLADEITRRETTSADRHARAASLDPQMTLDRWDDTAKVTYDHAVWNELCSLRFVDQRRRQRLPPGVPLRLGLAHEIAFARNDLALRKHRRTPLPATRPRSAGRVPVMVVAAPLAGLARAGGGERR
jgi:hypothetical protein